MLIKSDWRGLETGYTLISRFSTTLVFPVEDLGAPPDRGFGALGPSENTPNFLKRRYAAQIFLFPGGVRKKTSPVAVREKMGSNRTRTRFQLILAPFVCRFPPVHRLMQLSSESD